MCDVYARSRRVPPCGHRPTCDRRRDQPPHLPPVEEAVEEIHTEGVAALDASSINTVKGPSYGSSSDADTDEEHAHLDDHDVSLIDCSPVYVAHHLWHANVFSAACNGLVSVTVMIDTGALVVLILNTFADSLGLARHKLKSPFVASGPFLTESCVTFTEFVILDLSSVCNSWAAKPTLAMITSSLLSPILLGLPFINHNRLLIVGDDEDKPAIIQLDMGWELLNGEFVPPPVICRKVARERKEGKKTLYQKMQPPCEKRREALEDFKQFLEARKLMAAELKWRCADRRRDLKEHQMDGEHPCGAIPINAIAMVKATIEILASGETRKRLDTELKAEFHQIFEPIPHASMLPMTETAKIQLKNAERVIKMRSYSCARKFNEAFRTLIQQCLDSGFIQPSSSQFLSPSFIIPKPAAKGKMRWVCDYRGLNDNTVPDNFPLPNIDEILRDCAKGKVWGKIDMTDAFFQTRMHPNSVKYTAISTPYGAYEWLVMPMGFRNAPSIQQHRLTNAL